MPKYTLTNIAKTVRSEWFLIASILIAIGVVVLSVIGLNISKKPTERKETITWKNNIIAGETTKDELVKSLGQPTKIEDADNQASYFYDSTNRYRPHEVGLSEAKVNLIKEQVVGDEKGKLSDYLKKYGEPQATVYGRHGDFAPGHFWQDVGLLVFANTNDGTIVEIWYFEHQDLQNFLNHYPELKLQEDQNF